jgi:hypothetical protein
VKFSKALPRNLAVATLARKLADLENAAKARKGHRLGGDGGDTL